MYPARPRLVREAKPLDDFDTYIAGKQLHKTGSLDELGKGDMVSVGFDGNRIVKDLVEVVRREEPTVIGTNAVPLALYKIVSDTTQLYDSLAAFYETKGKHFRATTVFDGLGFRPQQPQRERHDLPPPDFVRSSATYGAAAAQRFHPSVLEACAKDFHVEDDVEGLLAFQLREVHPSTMRAPYLAWSQLSAFLAPAEGVVSAVYGCVELLAFPGVTRVITGFDVANGQYTYVARDDLLAALCQDYPPSVTGSSCLTEHDLSGLLLVRSRVPSFRFIVETPPPSSADLAARRAVRWRDLQPECYVRRNMAALDAPVLTSQGTLVQLTKVYEQPTKCKWLTTVFGAPPPMSAVYLMVFSPIPTTLLRSVLQGVIHDRWPLVDSPLFRGRSQHVLINLRAQVGNQLYRHFNLEHELTWARDYLFGMPPVSIHLAPRIGLVSWNVTPQVLPPVEEGYDESVFFDVAPSLLRYDTADPEPLPDARCTAASALMKSLDFLGYFSHSPEGPGESDAGVFCQALGAFDCATLTPYGVLFIELLRTECINDNPIVLLHGEQPEVLPMGLRFACRALSIVHVNVCSAWQGPIDYEMAAFGTVSRLLASTLRELLVSMTLLLFAEGTPSVPAAEFHSAVRLLPFGIPIEFHAGTLIKYVLTHREATLEQIQAEFPCLASVTTDLECLFWFWKMCYTAINCIRNTEPVPVSVQVVEAANTLIMSACMRLMPDYANMLLSM